MSVQAVTFGKRGEGAAVEAFREALGDRYAAALARVPGLARATVHLTLLSGYRRGEPAFDFVVEEHYGDARAAEAAEASDAFSAVRTALGELVSPHAFARVRTRENVIVDGEIPHDGVAMIAFLNRRADATLEHFRRYWRDTHGPIASENPGMRRYVQRWVDDAEYAAAPAPPFDGIPFTWFDDTDGLRTSGASDAYLKTRADEANFMLSGALPFVITRPLEVAID